MSLPEITRSIVVDAPPEEVWQALVDPERLEDWFADSVEGAPSEPDAEVTFGWEDGERRVAVVERVEPEERLELWWWREGDGGAASRVRFELAPAIGGTRVTVVESRTDAGARLPQLRAAMALVPA